MGDWLCRRSVVGRGGSLAGSAGCSSLGLSEQLQLVVVVTMEIVLWRPMTLRKAPKSTAPLAPPGRPSAVSMAPQKPTPITWNGTLATRLPCFCLDASSHQAASLSRLLGNLDCECCVLCIWIFLPIGFIAGVRCCGRSRRSWTGGLWCVWVCVSVCALRDCCELSSWASLCSLWVRCEGLGFDGVSWAYETGGSRERCQGLEGKRNLMGALVPQLESKGDVSLLVLKAYILSLFFLVVALFLAVGDAWIQYAEFYAMSSFSSNLTQHYLDFSLMVWRALFWIGSLLALSRSFSDGFSLESFGLFIYLITLHWQIGWDGGFELRS